MYGYSLILYCPLKLKYARICNLNICFSPFSVRPRFYDSMRTHVCIWTCPQRHVCPRDDIARAYAFFACRSRLETRTLYTLCKLFFFPDDCRGQSVAAAKRGFVHFMCMLPCWLFKWNYGQHRCVHTFIPTDNRFSVLQCTFKGIFSVIQMYHGLNWFAEKPKLSPTPDPAKVLFLSVMRSLVWACIFVVKIKKIGN